MRRFLILATVLGLLMPACNFDPGIQRLDTGPEQTVTINEPLPATDTAVRVELRMGGGALTLTGGANDLATGSIRYNVTEWEPTVTRAEDGASLLIAQGRTSGGIPTDRIINEWNLVLGNTPMQLIVNAGAYQNYMNLSGIPLQRLTISDGAADSEVIFNEPNPESLAQFSYSTGASNVRLNGLGHANISRMAFEGGVGTYLLDFSGELRQDAQVNVKVGLSTVRIVVPEETAVRVTVTGGMREVSTVGNWSGSDDVYEAGGSGPLLRIDVEMGMGDLTLVRQ